MIAVASQPALLEPVRNFLRTALNIMLAASSQSSKGQSAAGGTTSTAGGVSSDPPGGGSPERDAHLVERAQNGDRRAYQQLVLCYQTRVFSVVRGMVRNQEDAQDIVQDVFIRAYGSLDSFKGQSSFYTWLYRIAVNMTIDHRRKAGRRPTSEFKDQLEADTAEGAWTPGAHSESPQRQYLHRELGDQIQQAMEKLPEDQRLAVSLRELDGLSYKEIADIMQCSQGTVMSRLFYGRKKLQEMLKDLV